MPTHRAMVGFFVRLLVINALLMIPWPGWREMYATGFRTVANVLLGSMGHNGEVRFEPGDGNESGVDTQIVLRNRQTQAQSHLSFSCRYAGWMPTAMTMALVLATPLSWKKRLTALVFSLALVQAFVFARLWVYLAYLFSAGDTLAVLDAGPAVHSVLGAISDGLLISLIGSFLGPILIWLVIAVRKLQWSEPPKKPA